MSSGAIAPDDDGPMPIAEEQLDDDDDESEQVVVNVDEESYQENPRFKTWRKHVKDLYQLSVHIDTLWESPAVQFLPYITCKDHCATQTILCGTRTAGSGDQNYLQLANVTIPVDTLHIEDVGFNETTGEVGGYGMAPPQCSFRIERRMAHNGDVLSARYMHANPLVLGTCSSDGNAYIFDWSRISLLKPPNAPERPMCPLPPNAITDDSGPEEKAQHYRRLKAYRTVLEEQEKWDRNKHNPQHVLSLTGNCGKPQSMDFDTSTDGKLAVGSEGRICVWSIGNLPKDTVPKPERNGLPPPQVALQPTMIFADPMAVDDGDCREAAGIADVKFKWCDPQIFLAASLRGAVLQGDVRQPRLHELCVIDRVGGDGTGATCLAMPFEDSHVVFVGGSDGQLREYDTRMTTAGPVTASLFQGHAKGEVSVAQCCPHSPDLIATGGDDGFCCIFNIRNRSAPQLCFKHSAHVERVTDLGWNWQDVFAGMLVSSDPTSVTVWRPREFFFPAIDE